MNDPINLGAVIMCLIGILAITLGAYLESKHTGSDTSWGDMLYIAGFILIAIGAEGI